MGPVTETLSRARVLATARVHLERDGIDKLSLRGIARDLGVTAPALYAYVEGKQELLAAVATEHFDRLLERFEAVEAGEPLDRIRALARAYVDHALASPALFHLMLRFPPTPATGVDAFPPAVKAFQAAAGATAEAIERGELAPTDVDLAAMTMWSAVHGVSEVLLMGFGFDDEYADALVSSVIETVLAGQAA